MSGNIRIAGIVSESITDGPGIRYVLFVQGCPRRCEGCHNPEALPFDGGREVSADEIVTSIKKNPLLCGVTFSGGEPFSQSEALIPLAVEIKKLGLELAIYTGYTWEELAGDSTDVKYELLKQADIVVDGPFVKGKRNSALRFRGSSNQRILAAAPSLQCGTAVLESAERWTGKQE